MKENEIELSTSWWDNQLFLAKSKQKLLSTMKIPGMTKLFGSNTFNKLNRENLQRKAHFENFPSAKSTEKNVERCRFRRRAFNNMGNVHGYDIECGHKCGKNFSTIQSVIKYHESLTLKQMFDDTALLVNNQEEINCLDTILHGKNSWTRLSLIEDEVVINFQGTEVCVFSCSVLCLGKVLQHPESNEAWKNRVARIRAERNYRDYDAINGESTEFEWNIFP